MQYAAYIFLHAHFYILFCGTCFFQSDLTRLSDKSYLTRAPKLILGSTVLQSWYEYLSQIGLRSWVII